MITFVRRGLEAALIVMVLGVVGLAAAAQVAPLVDGGLYAVRSSSMVPALGVGDLVVVQAVNPEAIRVGEVITIRLASGATMTHRVAAVTETDDGPLFKTSGDANGGPDAVYARADQVVGRLAWHVPWLGFLLAMVTMPSGLAALFSVGVTLLTAVWLLDEVEAADEDDELEGLDADTGPDLRAATTPPVPAA